MVLGRAFATSLDSPNSSSNLTEPLLAKLDSVVNSTITEMRELKPPTLVSGELLPVFDAALMGSLSHTGFDIIDGGAVHLPVPAPVEYDQAPQPMPC